MNREHSNEGRKATATRAATGPVTAKNRTDEKPDPTFKSTPFASGPEIPTLKIAYGQAGSLRQSDGDLIEGAKPGGLRAGESVEECRRVHSG